MATRLEDLKILKTAEDIADAVWKQVVGWDAFAQDVVGKQFARATESIGANNAESYGRFNYGEKLQFLLPGNVVSSLKSQIFWRKP